MKYFSRAIFSLVLGIGGCSRTVMLTPDVASDSSSEFDQIEVIDSGAQDASNRADAQDITDANDAGSILDASDTGLCDPMRVRARNSGQRCWNPFPDRQDWACGTSLQSCQLGVCCSGRINPVTCDCECPVADAACAEFRLHEVCCSTAYAGLEGPALPPGCHNPGNCARSVAGQDWHSARDL